jgi:hypothetical protein
MAATMGLQREIESKRAPQEAMKRYLSLVTESFAKSKWFPIDHSPDTVAFGRKRFHMWQILVAILLFPVGLLALLAEKQKHWANAVFVEKGSGTVIMVTGAVQDDVQIEALLDYVQNWIDSDTTVDAPA